jgi:hypothetical protein
MSNTSTFIPSEIVRFIEATGENDHIDCKESMLWDSAVASACLAKDIAAFANSRDGGVIVLGKSEPAPGKFTLDGLSDAEAASYDMTKVANWVNSRFAPPIRFACHRQEHLGKVFIVITVAEFEDVPHICTKSFQDPANPKKHLLREGTIYVRNAGAASAPLNSVDDVRALVGLATAKRGRELLSMFESMLKGRPLLPPPNDQELYDKEFQRISSALGKSFQQMIQTGAWVLRVYPRTHETERWKTADELEGVIQKRSVRLREEFPPSYRGTHMREWGICNDIYGDVWTLARSGQFVCVRPFWENKQPYECPWTTLGDSPAEPNVASGQWLDFTSNIFRICEMFMFIVRFVEEYGPGEVVAVDLRATCLSGRKLLTTDFRLFWRPTDPCRSQLFEFAKRVSVEELRADWELMCAEAMRQFVELFPGPRIGIETMVGWIQKFKKREF